jgi:mannose-6-phosphate isomerase-like protein (cupin superfamily)
MQDSAIIKIDQVPMLDRGGGVRTWPLVVRTRVPQAGFTTGMSVYPVGKGAPMHFHNCAEQVTLLEGRGEVEVEGEVTPLVPYDSTYIPAGRMHCFRNTGDQPMRILWIYDSNVVTRTFQGSNEAVEHLSAADMMVAAARSE